MSLYGKTILAAMIWTTTALCTEVWEAGWQEDSGSSEPAGTVRSLQLVLRGESLTKPQNKGDATAEPDEQKLADAGERLAKLAHCSVAAPQVAEKTDDSQPETQKNEQGSEIVLLEDKKTAKAAAIVRGLCRAIQRGRALVVQVVVDAAGDCDPAVQEAIKEYGEWMEVNGEAIEHAQAVPGITLPKDWSATIVGEDTYLIAPEIGPNEVPKKYYFISIPAHEIDTVKPEVLGQNGVKVRIERKEEPGKDEPRAFMRFSIPGKAWKDAKLGIPVLKLINAQ